MTRVLHAFATTLLIGLVICVTPLSSVMSQETATVQVVADSKIKSLLDQIDLALGKDEKVEMYHLMELLVAATNLLPNASPDGHTLMTKFPDRLKLHAGEARADGKLIESINFEVFAAVAEQDNQAPAAKPAIPPEPPKPEPIVAKAEPSKPVITPEPAPKVAPSDMRALVDRGDATLKLGDVSAARMLYARAAESGIGIAALKLADTYDPTFLADHNLRGIKPDQAEAEAWYRKAASLGEAQAEQRLKNLESHRLANLLVRQ